MSPLSKPIARKKFIPGAKGKVANWDESSFRQIRAIYYGMISEVDSQLGRLWSSIKAAGEWDDTIIVLTSDPADLRLLLVDHDVRIEAI